MHAVQIVSKGRLTSHDHRTLLHLGYDNHATKTPSPLKPNLNNKKTKTANLATQLPLPRCYAAMARPCQRSGVGNRLVNSLALRIVSSPIRHNTIYRIESRVSTYNITQSSDWSILRVFAAYLSNMLFDLAKHNIMVMVFERFINTRCHCHCFVILKTGLVLRRPPKFVHACAWNAYQWAIDGYV